MLFQAIHSNTFDLSIVLSCFVFHVFILANSYLVRIRIVTNICQILTPTFIYISIAEYWNKYWTYSQLDVCHQCHDHQVAEPRQPDGQEQGMGCYLFVYHSFVNLNLFIYSYVCVLYSGNLMLICFSTFGTSHDVSVSYHQGINWKLHYLSLFDFYCLVFVLCVKVVGFSVG